MNWIEINKQVLVDNVKKIREAYAGNQNVGAMIKANAYGHGCLEVVACLEGIVDVFYVTSPDDAKKIVKKKIDGNSSKRVICVGEISEEEAIELADLEIEFAIIDPAFLQWNISRFTKKPKVHIFIDTGLGREGIRWNDNKMIDSIIEKQFEIVGLMTHFSNAEHEGPPEYAVRQLNRYDTALEYIHNKNIYPEKHTAASVPSMLYPDARYDITRIGIMLYGYWTSVESKIVCKSNYDKFPDVKPALSWKAITRNIKTIPKGDYVGYDCAYLCQKDTRVATINVGYYDGYPCLFNSNGWALVNGQRCPIIGNVMMNSLVIDITDVNVNSDVCTVVLLGESGNERITADDLASWAGLTNYDVLAAIKSHVKKCIV